MEVCDQLDDVKVEWENIGLHLSLPYKILENIENEHSRNQKRLRKMILAWLNGRGKKTPTWQSLIDALKHHTVGENATADDIRTYVLSKKASGKHAALLTEYSVLISPAAGSFMWEKEYHALLCCNCQPLSKKMSDVQSTK